MDIVTLEKVLENLDPERIDAFWKRAGECAFFDTKDFNDGVEEGWDQAREIVKSMIEEVKSRR
jgi:hypothetical protein